MIPTQSKGCGGSIYYSTFSPDADGGRGLGRHYMIGGSTLKLRELLQSDQKPVVAPGISDVVSAKVIESLGFPALYMGGWMMGAHYGTSEPLLSLTEITWLASYVTRYSKLPLIVDAGAGWGDPLQVQRTVQEMERVGVAAIHIEDQVFPKRATYFKGIRRIIDKGLMAERIQAAVQARKKREFVIIARTDAWKAEEVSTLHDVIDRMQACVAAGADVVMPMVKDIKYVPTLRKALPSVPMIWLQYFGGPTLKEVSDAGCDLVIFPQACMLLALNAIKEGFTEVRNRGRLESYDLEWMNRGMKKELLGLLGIDAYYELEARTTEGRERS